MARYRQITNPETGKSEFIPVGKGHQQQAHAVHGDIEPFVSPIDGAVISDRKEYREHCKKHNVVPAAEFNQEFFYRKAEERQRALRGERTKQQVLRDRQELYERITRHEG